jgi:hypothetical protein
MSTLEDSISEYVGKKTTTWDGLRSHFNVYRIRLIQYSKQHSFYTVLVNQETIPTAEESETGKVKTKNADGTAGPERDITEAEKNLYARDAKAMSRLATTLPDKVTEHIFTLASAYHAWQYLERTYYTKTAEKDLETILNDFTTCLPGNFPTADEFFLALDSTTTVLKEIDKNYGKTDMDTWLTSRAASRATSGKRFSAFTAVKSQLRLCLTSRSPWTWNGQRMGTQTQTLKEVTNHMANMH